MAFYFISRIMKLRVHTMEVEILSVSKAVDLPDKNVARVQLGRVAITDEQREAFKKMGITPVIATLYYNFEDVAPYIVGSRWNLRVEENGQSLILEKIEK